jgi:hypothetical protein
VNKTPVVQPQNSIGVARQPDQHNQISPPQNTITTQNHFSANPTMPNQNASARYMTPRQQDLQSPRPNFSQRQSQAVTPEHSQQSSAPSHLQYSAPVIRSNPAPTANQPAQSQNSGGNQNNSHH